MADPSKVYAFYDDFSSSTMKKEWVKVWGQWSVQNGRLLGNTMKSKTINKYTVEPRVYLKSGFHWKDVEVELDLMETSQLRKSDTGPFLRLSNVNPSNVTRLAGGSNTTWALQIIRTWCQSSTTAMVTRTTQQGYLQRLLITNGSTSSIESLETEFGSGRTANWCITI